MYHATYLSWFEVGRTEMMREAGYPYAAFERERGLRLTVVEAHLCYLAAGLYDEPVRIESWIDGMRPVRFLIRHRISSEPRGCVLATGFIVLACVTNEGKVRAVPQDVRAALEKFSDQDEGGKEPKERLVTTRYRGASE